MKPRKLFYLIGCLLSLTFLLPLKSHGQDKERVRVSLSYVGEMPETSRIQLMARFRGENGFEPAGGLEFHIYNLYPNDSLVETGTAVTGMGGQITFTLPALNTQYRDTTGLYTYRVVSSEHPRYDEVERDISFKRARLDVYVVEENEAPYLRATLTDEYTGEPVSEQPLRVGVERLFRPLTLGGDFNMTDESGSIDVLIGRDIPGLNGNLTLMATLSEHEEYGTLTASTQAPLGVPIVDTSTFDQRTMWGPPSKTPLFLLTVPNLIILGVWGTIVFLIHNLYKISKSKNSTT